MSHSQILREGQYKTKDSVQQDAIIKFQFNLTSISSANLFLFNLNLAFYFKPRNIILCTLY